MCFKLFQDEKWRFFTPIDKTVIALWRMNKTDTIDYYEIEKQFLNDKKQNTT